VRIGIVTEYYRPWPGGISEHVHHEALELRRRGHEVSIWTGPATSDWRGDDEGVTRFAHAIRFTSNGALSRMVLSGRMLRMRALLRRAAFDVVHVHAPLDPVLGMLAVWASETATVGTFHASFGPSSLWETLFRRLRPISETVWRRLDARIAVSPEARRSIEHYFPGEYEIIPNGVDCERFHPGVVKLPELDDGRPNILFVGRSDPRKGLPILLEAFAQIRGRMPGVRLVVVGVQRAEVASLVSGLPAGSADDILFAGYAAPESMPAYFASCDVFCSPAKGQESQGIVLLEAMAAGRPPLAFAIPGYRDVVHHGRDGWLLSEIGVQPLADALRSLLGDREGLRRLGEAGRETALGYSWPAVAARIEGVFGRARERRKLQRRD
jgi:phosphatidyl-myo-inositol alpha-mannosyltransferase